MYIGRGEIGVRRTDRHEKKIEYGRFKKWSACVIMTAHALVDKLKSKC